MRIKKEKEKIETEKDKKASVKNIDIEVPKTYVPLKVELNESFDQKQLKVCYNFNSFIEIKKVWIKSSTKNRNGRDLYTQL